MNQRDLASISDLVAMEKERLASMSEVEANVCQTVASMWQVESMNRCPGYSADGLLASRREVEARELVSGRAVMPLFQSLKPR